MPKLQPLKLQPNEKCHMFSTQFIQIQAKLIRTKFITCNLNRYKCTQIRIFLAAINTETKFCTWRFFNDKAMYQHLLLQMKMILQKKQLLDRKKVDLH